MAGIVIVGAGQAAAATAAKLRALKCDAPILMIGDEPHLPYQRPPLSKAYLLGELPADRLALRPASFWFARGVEILTGQPVTAIHRDARQVETPRARFDYDQLVLATGASPRGLPAAIGGDLRGVHTLRGLADIDRLSPALAQARRLLVVGGGYIGLEAAAVARKLGKEVTLIEAAPRILARVAATETASALRRRHQDRGVEILENVTLDRLLEQAGAVCGARLTDGREIGADLAIIGIGAAPNTALAEAAGLVVENGVALDSHLRSSDDRIWAAGDCASFPHKGERRRLESVGNAVDMGEAVAANIMGAARPYEPEPWFWSDQYDTKLQIAGLHSGHDHIAVRQADGLSFWYYREGRLIALDAINDTGAYMIGKKLLATRQSPEPSAVSNPDVNLRTLLG